MSGLVGGSGGDRQYTSVQTDDATVNGGTLASPGKWNVWNKVMLVRSDGVSNVYPIGSDAGDRGNAIDQAISDGAGVTGSFIWYPPLGSANGTVKITGTEQTLAGGGQGSQIRGTPAVRVNLGAGGDSDGYRTWVRDLGIRSGFGTAFEVTGAGSNVKLANIRFTKADGGDALNIGADASEVYGWGLSTTAVASQITGHALNCAGTDCRFQLYAPNQSIQFTSDAQDCEIRGHFASVTNNGTRCVVNNVSVNAGDPNSTGDWNGNGREGVKVRDTTNSDVYQYLNGSWVELPENAGQSYSPSNVTTDRTYDANSTTTAELADILGTLISDLETAGVLD